MYYGIDRATKVNRRVRRKKDRGFDYDEGFDGGRRVMKEAQVKKARQHSRRLCKDGYLW